MNLQRKTAKESSAVLRGIGKWSSGANIYVHVSAQEISALLGLCLGVSAKQLGF
jgi:hypothetical protein